MSKPVVLITGATGKIGENTLRNLEMDRSISLIAAVHTHAKAKAFECRGIRTVVFDLDKEESVAAALSGVDRAFLMTSYTVEMLRQSKLFLDQAKKAGVLHVVHLGACGRDDTSIAHWAWHQFVERYIEWCGFTYTHLRPENFMQNLLSYSGAKAVKNGVIQQYTGDARISWVDCEDVALVAAQALSHPDKHAGKTYRLGYDAKSYEDIAAIMTNTLVQPFRYEPLPPASFLEDMRAAGAEMAYMNCVADSFERIAAYTVPGVADTFDDFYSITGRDPVRWEEFVQKHKEAFLY